MRRLSLCLLLTGSAGALAVSSLSAQTFTRTSEIPPLRLSYSNLADILGRMHQIMATSNASFSAPPYESILEFLDISDKQSNVDFQHDMTAAAFASSAPEVANNVYYFYRYEGAPISHVELRLGDYSRELVVGGQSKTDVDALSNLISGDLNKYTFSLTGTSFRNTGSMFLLLVFVCFSIIGLAIPLPRKVRIALFLASLAIVALLFFVPWAAWLPGTAVYAGDASWVVRHEAGVTFIGTVAGIVGFAVLVIRGVFKGLRITSDEPTHENAMAEVTLPWCPKPLAIPLATEGVKAAGQGQLRSPLQIAFLQPGHRKEMFSPTLANGIVNPECRF